MTRKYRIIFKNNTVHDRWAAHSGGEARQEIEIPGNWWSADWSRQFHFEELLLNARLISELSSEDKIRFGVAYKVYDDVTNGVGYFGEGTSHDQASGTAIGEQPGA